MPSDFMRRLGQSIAAASLPKAAELIISIYKVNNCRILFFGELIRELGYLKIRR